ncbi:MAG TPA: ABC-type transport auxiliary lipoprotein family protein [Terriglobia bacterium]|nr:ABC-type transport auxiliary lipoprotein family protein [Terriglobia bacterium]
MGCFVLVLLAATLMGACGGGRPIHYYTMQLPPAPTPSTRVFPAALLIGRINAPEILQDEPIVYRSGPNEIGTYPYHEWVEPPAQVVRDMLFRRFRASGEYRSVDELGSSAQGDYILHGKLYDFEEVDTGNITALVSMEVELFDRRTGKTVWTHSYTNSTPVQGKEIPDVVSALNRNLDQGVTEVAAGLDAYFSANVHRKP